MIDKMALTIKLDRKFLRRAVKIEDVVSDAVLAAEFASVEL